LKFFINPKFHQFFFFCCNTTFNENLLLFHILISPSSHCYLNRGNMFVEREARNRN
jgi:hypothetical protein